MSVVACLVYLVFFLTMQGPLLCCFFFFLMIRRPPRSTLDRSSAASDVYKRQQILSERPFAEQEQILYKTAMAFYGVSIGEP